LFIPLGLRTRRETKRCTYFSDNYVSLLPGEQLELNERVAYSGLRTRAPRAPAARGYWSRQLSRHGLARA
jgi:hypothetical protein